MKLALIGSILPAAVVLAVLATSAADVAPLTPSQFHARPVRAGDPVSLTGMLTYKTMGWSLTEDAKAYGTETDLPGIVPRLVQLSHRLPSIDHNSIGEGAIVELAGTTIDTGCTRRRCIEVPPEVNVTSLKIRSYGERFAYRSLDERGSLFPEMSRDNPDRRPLEQLALRMIGAVRAHDRAALKAMFAPISGEPTIDELAAPDGDFDWIFFDPKYSFAAYPAANVPHALLQQSDTHTFAFICFARTSNLRAWPQTTTELYHANITDAYVCYFAEKSERGWGLSANALAEN